MVTWGLQNYGLKLSLNTLPEPTRAPLVVDVEHDEKEGWVGMGIYDGGSTVHYVTERNLRGLDALVGQARLIGHNFKSDLHVLDGWGFKVNGEQLVFDTRLASYTMDANSYAHDLYTLEKDVLAVERPTYHDIVGKGKEKVTFDKQPVEIPANKCAIDCVSTWKLKAHFEKVMDVKDRWYLDNIEMPTARTLFEMERKGIRLDTEYMGRLAPALQRAVDRRKKILWQMAGEEFNPNSSQQKVKVLRRMGFDVKGTDRKKDLTRYEHEPFIAALIRYSKVQTINSTFSHKLLALAMQNEERRIYGEMNQTAASGRLTSCDPNMQNMPSKGRLGDLVRRAFIAKPGYKLVCADASQLEPRVLAHRTNDPYLVDTFRSGRDVYNALIAGTGRNRDAGKVFFLALTYGSKAKTLAAGFKCSVEEAQAISDRGWENVPFVKKYQLDLLAQARRDGYIRTLFGRRIQVDHLNSDNNMQRWGAERQLINRDIQGSGQEVIKWVMRRCAEKGLIGLLQVHDELLFEVKSSEAEAVRKEVLYQFKNAVDLRVPLDATCGIGDSWLEAKI